MKTLSNGTEVPSRCFYYLLEWNEQNNWELIQSISNQQSLTNLNHEQFWTLFRMAVNADIANAGY